MRAQMTITELTDDQWDYLQANVQAEYDIQDGASRLCLTFTHGDEERHVEMPMGTLIGLLAGLSLVGLNRRFREIMDQVRVSDLGIFLNKVRDEADPARTSGPTCDYGAVVTDETPSVFEGAQPTRTYADGCQSYGPYWHGGPGEGR